MTPGALQRLLAPLANRVRLLISRGVITLVNDGLRMQGLQLELTSDEVADDVERFQDYGFTSVPHAGAEAVALSIGASREHLVVIAVDDRRYRLTGLEQGEVAIYTDEGDSIVLKRDRKIEVTGGAEVTVTSPTIKLVGDVEVQGELQVTGSVGAGGDVSDGGSSMAAMRTAYNGHVHTPGSPTTSIPSTPM